jgi:tRNA U34 5-methylaminomethyl-2-thiouridine-forming methyltransferase MnmC
VPSTAGYKIVRLASGVYSVHSLAERETFHPVIGPVAEAEALYVKQLRLPERLAAHSGEFVIWDVGLGAAANVLTVLRATRATSCPIRIISFDHTLAPLQFALENAATLGYFTDYETAVQNLLRNHRAEFSDGHRQIYWELHLGDFPSILRDTQPATRNAENPTRLPPPHAILFDAFSPAKNPAMWTAPLFANLFRHLDPARPCALPTYSRSTMLRVSLLLAGFFVGAGHATGEKEETSIAANTLALISEPLDKKWLQRVRNSTSAEPMWEPIYRQAPLSEDSWQKLQLHPQFK